MSRTSLALGLISTALAVAGCSTASNQTVSDPAATPLSATRHGAGHADAHYALGRYYQGQVRYEQAIQSYVNVLEAQPDHADAHNALGVIYAIQGRQAMAEKELRTALSLAPAAAHIHNNLGYALLLQGRDAEAVSAFQEALRLDPAQARAADNLQVALARLEASPGKSPAAPAPVNKVQAQPQPVMPLASVEMKPTAQVRPIAPSIYELRWPVAAVQEAGRPSPILTELERSPIRLEVSNGNGVGGLARKTSRYLKGIGYDVARLTNQKPFDQDQTLIQYRPGSEQQAVLLKQALAGKGVVAKSGGLRQDIQVRVVLGKDVRRFPELAAEDAAYLRLAAADQPRPEGNPHDGQ